MAYKEEIELDINVTGADAIDAALGKTKKLQAASDEMTGSEQKKSNALRDGANAALENGGAMGLLNDLTNGYAMMLKDGVEAMALFAKGSKLAAAAQAVWSFAVKVTTGTFKSLKGALISTGIGALIVGLGLLIANFGAVTSAIGKFIGATSDAKEEMDKLNESVSEGLKEQEMQLEINGDKYDEYTRRKMKAEIDYRNKVKELAEMDDDELSDEQRLQFMKDAREKMKREIKLADDDSRKELDNTLADWRKKQEDANAKTNMDKINLDQKRAMAEITNLRATETEKAKLRKDIENYYNGQRTDEQARMDADAQKKRDEEIAKVKANRESIKKILDDYRKKEQDALAVTNMEKIDLEEQRAIKELELLRASRKEKEKVNKYYDDLRKKEEERLAKERLAIEEGRAIMQKNLELDKQQWDIDHEVDPMSKLKLEKKYLQDQANLQVENLKQVIANKEATETERAEAENELLMVKQNRDQAIRDNELKQLELETEREDERLAKQKERLDELAEKRQAVDFMAAEWLDKVSHEGEKRTDEEMDRDRSVAQNRLNVGLSTAKALLDLGGKGSELAKGMAAAQAVQDTLKGANAAYASLAGIPIVGPALGAVAYAGAMVQGYGNVKKILATKQVEKSAPSGGGSVPAGGGPASPSFNLVQGTGSNQIAEAVANAGQTPIQAYVVSNNVTTAQSLERNIVSESMI